MEQRMIDGFIPAHRRYMRATLGLMKAGKPKKPEETALVEEQKEAGNRMVKAIREARIRGWDFRTFYAQACGAIRESDPFLLLDREEENSLLLGLRLYELESIIREKDEEQNTQKSGMVVFLGTMATRDGYSWEIRDLFKEHAYIFWQLVGKGHGSSDILDLRQQAKQLTPGEVANLRNKE